MTLLFQCIFFPLLGLRCIKTRHISLPANGFLWKSVYLGKEWPNRLWDYNPERWCSRPGVSAISSSSPVDPLALAAALGVHINRVDAIRMRNSHAAERPRIVGRRPGIHQSRYVHPKSLENPTAQQPSKANSAPIGETGRNSASLVESEGHAPGDCVEAWS